MKKLLLVLMALLAAIPSVLSADLYVVGDLKLNGTQVSSDPNQAYKLSSNNGVFNFEVENVNWVKYSTSKGDWDTFNYNGFQATNYNDVTLSENDLNKAYYLEWSFAKNVNPPSSSKKYDVIFTIAGNKNGKSSNIVYKETYPSSMYLIGNINTSDFVFGTGTAMSVTGSNGTYQYNNVKIADSGDGFGYFQFAEKAGTSWDVVNGGKRFGATEKNLLVKPGETKNLAQNGAASESWRVAAGTYTIKLNLANNNVQIVSGSADVTTVFYLDLSNFPSPWSAPKAYCWTGGDDENKYNAAWPGEAMIAQGNNVWKYEFAGSYEKVIFNYDKTQSQDLALFPDKTYKLDPTKSGNLPELSFPAPSDAYIYVYLGEAYYTQKKWENKTPYVFFNGDGAGKNQAMEKEEEVTWLPLYKFKVPEGKTSLEYLCSADNPNPGDNEMQYKKNAGWTDYEWWKYIYFCDAGELAQSYCTYDEFKDKYKNRLKHPIYTLGMAAGDNDASWSPSNQDNYRTIQSSDGVFIENLGSKGMNVANEKFKMSYLHPVEDFTHNGASYTSPDKRLWATFNLGLIGPALRFYTSPTDTEGIPYPNDENGSTPGIYVRLNSTVSYNSYNSNNWHAYKGDEDDEDYKEWDDLYLLVDLENRTAVLLDFNPQPELSLTLNDYDIHDLDKVSQDTKIEDAVVPGSDDSGNNVATFRFVNVVGASGSLLTASPNESFFESYNVEYDINFDGETIGRIKDTTGEDRSLEVKTMLPEEGENTLASRAYYTDKNRYSEDGKPLVFRSRTAIKKGNYTFDHSKPEKAPEVKYFQVYDSDAAEGYYDALVGISFELPHRFVNDDNIEEIGDKAIYPSYEVWVEDVNTGARYNAQLVPTTSTYALNNTDFMTGKGTNDGYTFPTAETTGQGSWAYQAMNTSENMKEGYLPLYVPSVAKKGSPYKLKVHAKIFAVYPYRLFSADKNIEATVESPQSLNAAKRRVGTVDDTNSSIYTYSEESPESESDEKNYGNSLSGIEDVTVGESSDSFELFNLQGVRIVDANPAPGVYLRRAADGTTAKHVIR